MNEYEALVDDAVRTKHTVVLVGGLDTGKSSLSRNLLTAAVEAVAIADVNDPALVVARAQGRCGPVIVMDDNVSPESYWPCFQAIVSRLPRRSLRGAE